MGRAEMSAHVLGLELTLLLAFWLSLAVWQKDPETPGRLNFVLLAVAVGLWCFGELVGLRGAVPEQVADRIKYAGALPLPSLWLGLAARGARLELAARMPWFPLVLLAPLAVPYALLYSESWGGLFLTVVEGGPDVHGPLWWVVAFYNFGLALVGSAALLHAAWQLRAPDAPRQRALALGACTPLAASAVYVATGQTWTHDPTPVLLGVALLGLRGAAFSGELFQLLPITQRDLLQQLPIGVVLTDRHGTIQSVNRAAARRLGVDAEAAAGRHLEAVVESAPDPPTLESLPIRSFDREAGQIVLLDPAGKKRD